MTWPITRLRMRRSKGLIAYGKLAYANTRLRLRVGRGLVAHDLLVVSLATRCKMSGLRKLLSTALRANTVSQAFRRPHKTSISSLPSWSKLACSLWLSAILFWWCCVTLSSSACICSSEKILCSSSSCRNL